MRGRVHHVVVDDLAYPRVEAHLLRGENGYEVFVDDPRLLLDLLRVPLSLQLFARLPEENVLIGVLALEEFREVLLAA